MSVGERLKQLRGKESLRKLGARVNISPSFLSDIERGKTNPSLENLEIIAEALGTSKAYLLGETNDPTPPPKETSIPVSGTSRSTTDAEVNAPASDEIPVPLYRMGPGDDTPKPIRTMIFRRSVLGDSPAKAYIGIEMRDTSMEPRIPDGSIVVIDTTQTEPRRGGMYYVRFKKDGKCERDAVRFVYPAKEGGYELKSAEGSGIPPDMFTEEGMKNSVEIVGEVLLKLTIERV